MVDKSRDEVEEGEVGSRWLVVTEVKKPAGPIDPRTRMVPNEHNR